MGQSTSSGNPATATASLQDAQPVTVMPLWKAKLEEPRSDQSDSSVMIVDNSSKRKRQRRRGYISQARRWAQVDRQMRLKQAAATKVEIKQLNWSCEACKGTPSVPLTVELEDGSVHYQSFPSTNFESKEGSGGSGVCVICVDASAEAACVPCGHVAGCLSCLKEINNKKLGCPICRASIDQVIKLYHV